MIPGISAVVRFLVWGSEVSSTVTVVAFFVVGGTANSGMGVSVVGALNVGRFHILVE